MCGDPVTRPVTADTFPAAGLRQKDHLATRWAQRAQQDEDEVAKLPLPFQPSRPCLQHRDAGDVFCALHPAWCSSVVLSRAPARPSRIAYYGRGEKLRSLSSPTLWRSTDALGPLGRRDACGYTVPACVSDLFLLARSASSRVACER